MSIIRGIEAVDKLTVNLGGSAGEIAAAMDNKDTIGILHGATKHALGYVQGTNYAATAVDKGGMLAKLFAKHAPFTVNAKVLHFLEGITMVQILAGIGIVLSSLTVIVNSISIYRQNEVLSVIKKAEEEAKKQNSTPDEMLAKTLDALDKINYNHFRGTLPEHLKARIDALGGKDAPLSNLQADVKNGQTEIARRIVSDIKEYVAKKRVTHILTLIGGIASLAASIALLVSCPPLAITLLVVIGLAFTIASALVSMGWVENNKDGFNWKLCLPEFIQKKLTIDKEFESELTVMTSTHDLISPQLNMPQLSSTPSEEDSKAFREPLVIKVMEPEKTEKGPTRWEKFKALFKREEKAAVEETKPKKNNILIENVIEIPKSYVSHPLEENTTLSLREAMAMQGMFRIGP